MVEEPPAKRAKHDDGCVSVSALCEPRVAGPAGTVRTMELVSRHEMGSGDALASAASAVPLSLGFASGVAAGCASAGSDEAPTVFVVDRGRKRVIKLDEEVAPVSEDSEGLSRSPSAASLTGVVACAPAPQDVSAGGVRVQVRAAEAWRSAEVVLPQMVALALGPPRAQHAKSEGEAPRRLVPDLIVSDSRKCRIVRVSGSSGRVLEVLAGSGMSGGRDGKASRATFAGPWGVACDDRTGDVFVSEYFGCKIRLIRNGDVTTLAGSGPKGGHADGLGPAASFAGPRGVCFDARRNALFIADSGNHCVRKLDVASGAVTTVCGDGTRGYRDGPAAAARFDEPTAVALDVDGTLYVADQENRRVRALRGRTVSTLAGGGLDDTRDGVGADAHFSLPNSLYLCPAIRRLYVGDKQTVRVVTLPDPAPGPDPASRRAADLSRGAGAGAAARDAHDAAWDAAAAAAPPSPLPVTRAVLDDPTNQSCVWCAPRPPPPETPARRGDDRAHAAPAAASPA